MSITDVFLTTVYAVEILGTLAVVTWVAVGLIKFIATKDNE